MYIMTNFQIMHDIIRASQRATEEMHLACNNRFATIRKITNRIYFVRIHLRLNAIQQKFTQRYRITCSIVRSRHFHAYTRICACPGHNFASTLINVTSDWQPKFAGKPKRVRWRREGRVKNQLDVECLMDADETPYV